MKFLCDRMLGTLAKWLRVYGFDTFYANSEMNDEELLCIAKTENRTLITRDKNLSNVVRRENLKVIEFCTTDLDEQLRLVLANQKLYENQVLARCLICNSLLSEIKKDVVKKKVPKRVFEGNERFWFCSKCDKIYWKGTHYDKMIEKIDYLKKP